MEAKELMLGNLINKHFEGGEGEQEIVTSRTIFDCQTNPTGKFTYTGIPLSDQLLQECAFTQLPHFTVQNLWEKSIGRGRVISIASVGTPNEMVFITESEPPQVKNVIVVRNYDYDGKTCLHHIQNIYQIFTNSELLPTQ